MDTLLLSAFATEPTEIAAENHRFGQSHTDESQPDAPARESALTAFLGLLGRGVIECVIPFPTRNDRLTLRESLFS